MLDCEGAVGIDDASGFRAHVEQCLYVAFCFFHRLFLQGLAHRIEKHHGHRFRIFADAECPYRCNRHKQELVEKILAVYAFFPCLFKDRQAYRQIGKHEQQPAVTAGGKLVVAVLERQSRGQKHRRDDCRHPSFVIMRMSRIAVFSVTMIAAHNQFCFVLQSYLPIPATVLQLQAIRQIFLCLIHLGRRIVRNTWGDDVGVYQVAVAVVE